MTSSQIKHGITMPGEEDGKSSAVTYGVTVTDDGMHEFGSIEAAFAQQWTVGRAPWYDASGQRKKPFIIGVTGGTASGKTTVCDEIVKRLGLPWVVMLSMDRFYKSLPQDELNKASDHNFDHPDAFDWDGLRDSIKDLTTSRSVKVPKYSFVTHQRLPETDTFYGADVVIVEGILVLYSAEVREQLDMKVFVDTDDDVRLARRIKRDIACRGRTVDDVLHQYMTTVKPSYDDFIAPTKRYADIIIPRGGDNYVAIDLLVEHIRRQLELRGLSAAKSFQLPCEGVAVPNVFPGAVKVLDKTPALTEIHTAIRDEKTSQQDFQHNVHRAGRLLLSEAFNLLKKEKTAVTTPTGANFDGNLLKQDSLCAVSIVRGGESLEVPLKEFAPEIPIGKIVIQQSKEREEGPRLYYCKLPADIVNRQVLLLDGTISTGNAVNMAIRVLLDHHVPEENIIFCCLAAAPQGLDQVVRTFPKVRVVTTWLDDGLDGNHFLTPGLGSLGHRYFGTEEPSFAAAVPASAAVAPAASS